MISKRSWGSAASGLFGAVWLTTAVLHIATGFVSTIFLVFDSIGLGMLLYKYHPKVTRGLDERPRGGGNFYEDNFGIRLLVVLSSLIYLGYLIRYYGIGISGGGVIESVVTPMIPDLSSPIGVLIVSAPVFTLGGYLYKAGDKLEGPFHRTSRVLMNSIESDDRTIELLEKALSGNIRPRYQYTTLSFHLIANGLVLAVVSMMMAFIGVHILAITPLLILVIMFWMVHEFGQTYQSEREVGLGEIADIVETPQSWFFELRLLKGGLKSLFATSFCVVGVGFAMLLSLLSLVMVGGLTRVPEVLNEADISKATWIEQISVTGEVIALVALFLSVASILFLAAAYAFMIWFVLMNRLPLWLTEFGTQAIEGIDSQDSYSLPRYGVLFAGAMIGGVGIIAAVGPWVVDTFSLPPLALAFFLVAVCYFWVFKKGLDEGISDTNVQGVRYDNYRIFALVFVQMAALALPLRDPEQIALVTGLFFLGGGIYFLPDFFLYIGRQIEKEIHRNILESWYLTVVLSFTAVFVYIIFNVSAVYIVSVSAVLLGILYLMEIWSLVVDWEKFGL